MQHSDTHITPRAFRVVMTLMIALALFSAFMVYYTGFVLPAQQKDVTHASPKR